MRSKLFGWPLLQSWDVLKDYFLYASRLDSLSHPFRVLGCIYGDSVGFGAGLVQSERGADLRKDAVCLRPFMNCLL